MSLVAGWEAREGVGLVLVASGEVARSGLKIVSVAR